MPREPKNIELSEDAFRLGPDEAERFDEEDDGPRYFHTFSAVAGYLAEHSPDRPVSMLVVHQASKPMAVHLEVEDGAVVARRSLTERAGATGNAFADAQGIHVGLVGEATDGAEEALAQVLAMLCMKLGLDSRFVHTHQEVDRSVRCPADPGLHAGRLRQRVDALRGEAARLLSAAGCPVKPRWNNPDE